jgi:hypothetical protein
MRLGNAGFTVFPDRNAILEKQLRRHPRIALRSGLRA